MHFELVLNASGRLTLKPQKGNIKKVFEFDNRIVFPPENVDYALDWACEKDIFYKGRIYKTKSAIKRIILCLKPS